jgi:hypothetical protein
MSKQRSFLNLRNASRGQTPPEPGSIAIDGYRVESLVGSGPLTAVYRALLESHQQHVVLKILLPHLAESEVFAQRFLQAANAARLVTHDRVLPCYDVGQSNGWVYLACELIEGDDFASLMALGPIERTRAVYLAWQIAMGLEAIHAADLVHGNLRPSNIHVDDEDGVRLADLGLPALIDSDPPAQMATPTALHLPPEAVPGEGGATAAGDIYAVGVLLIGALLGRTPRSGCTQQRLAQLHAAGQSVLAELPAGLIDPDLAAVLARATALRPEERYAEAWQLREDLERLQYQFSPIHARTAKNGGTASFSREAGSRSTRGVQEPAPRVPPPVRRTLWIAIGLGVCALAAVIGWVMAAGQAAAIATAAPVASVQPVAPKPIAPSAPQPPAIAKPVWAAEAGSDAQGRWADLVVGGARQRLRLIPAGNFWMGSATDDPGRSADEDRHLVTLTKPFWLGETEVTQEFYTAVVGTSPAHFQAPDLPVESVSWNTLQDFLARLGGKTGAPVRLPTEAEWEYACRAGSDQPLQPITLRAWTFESGIDGTRPVAKLQANAFGLYDMQGNVLEWVADTYVRYHRESVTDPLATGGVHRVIRGGAWNLDASASRPAARSKALPVAAFFYLGFRIAITD